MGLIKATLQSINQTLKDQWLEVLSADSLDDNVLMTIATRRMSKNNSNYSNRDGVISNGSTIIVADGQCMIIVESGKIVELASEPGRYVYNNDLVPSVFAGNLGSLFKNIKATVKDMAKRIAYGGDTRASQRVYFLNMKELVDNKFGTPTPIPFRVVDRNIGLDIDIDLQVSGTYSYKIENPITFYQNVAGNISDDYLREKLEGQLKSEFISSLQPAFSKLSELEIRPNQIPAHSTELEKILNEVLSEKWGTLRGLNIVSIGFNNINVKKEDAERIKKAQEFAMYRNPAMVAATMVGSQAEAMRTAAGNTAGAMTGFMGMGMASAAGGVNVNALFEAANIQANINNFSNPKPLNNITNANWFCPECGQKNDRNFCSSCGTKRPE